MSRLLANRRRATMGAMPVFMMAISTILGAILFLRFGYAVGHVGLAYTLLIIVVGHLVTIPTALAVAEISTNQKVLGGGAYFMISRSFGLNIGAAIGIGLFLSQAISVAFYVIAFAEACEPVIHWVNSQIGIAITKQMVGLVVMALLMVLMLVKGANIGMKALYVVVAILFVSLVFFFFGKSEHVSTNYFAHVRNPDSFFFVFAIIFPAFTGIAAGLGLSGDLKDPQRAIPRGTIWATVIGLIVYFAVAFKLFYSASLYDLANPAKLVMADISIWPPMIAIGLACAAVSSALGSIMIAPRTLQALGVDRIFPKFPSLWFAKGRAKDNEPVNSSIITCLIAFGFVAIGELNFVAQVISMFFMVTYGAICTISFLQHFAADPSYRPTFKSRWYFSLTGAVMCFYLMFKMNFFYAVMCLAFMFLIYALVSRLNKDRGGIVDLFKGVLFWMTRQMQVYLQRRDVETIEDRWRPFIVCITKDSFKRRTAFDMISWLSHKYGFGTYIHFIEGLLSGKTFAESRKIKNRLIHLAEDTKSRVYLDTMISPSYTSAIAQVIQVSGVSGKGNNMILFEFLQTEPEALKDVIDNYNLLRATDFDVGILRSSYKGFGYHKEIHIWISSEDYENSNLIILLAYILLGHPEWRKGLIKIFSVYPEGELDFQKERLHELIKSGRLPISSKNIELIAQGEEMAVKTIINQKSEDADLTIIGYRSELLKEQGHELFNGYDSLGNILFISAVKEKEIG